jgi:hypothetical protein
MKKLITITTLLLLVAISLMPQFGCGKLDNGIDLQTTPPAIVDPVDLIDWVDFIKFNNITYLRSGEVQTSFIDEDLYYFDEVKFKVAGNVNDPNYRSKNGDAAFLEKGMDIYSLTGYSPDFRLIAETGAEMILYEADTNPRAKKGADLLDIGGKVKYIGINSGIDGTTELASINEEWLVLELVDMILEAPVDQDFQSSRGVQYFIAFYLNDGTVVKRSYFIGSGNLHRGIMLPDEFGRIIDLIMTLSSSITSIPTLLPSPTGSPIISMNIDQPMRGQFSHLTIYDDGYVIRNEESGLRFPVAQHPPRRSWYTGQLNIEELTGIIDFFRSSGFMEMNRTYVFPGEPRDNGVIVQGDTGVTITISYGDLQKTVVASAYLAYADMPSPLNEIYDRLWGVALATSFVASEIILN